MCSFGVGVYQFSSNLPAPINVGSLEQTKEGNLIIEGVLRLGQFTTANAPSGTEGALYYDTTENTTKVYSSAAWGDLGGGDLWYASSTAVAFDNDVYVGGGLYVQGQRVICPAGQDGTDSFCDYVCTDYYVQTGTEGADSTEYCYNKTAITSANCGAVGGCKDSSYTNCNYLSNSTLQYECGICKYIDTVDCVNNVLNSCTNYGTDTYCAYNSINNGATNYHCSGGTCICDILAYTTAPDGKDNDCDGTIDEFITGTGTYCLPSTVAQCVNSCAAEPNGLNCLSGRPDAACTDFAYGCTFKYQVAYCLCVTRWYY